MTYKIVLLRPRLIDGRQYAGGAILEVDADAAEHLLRSGRARLADSADLPALLRELAGDADREPRLMTR